MKKAELEALDPGKVPKLAVAALSQNPDLPRPEGTEKLFKKLNSCENAMKTTMMAAEETKKTLDELQGRMDQTIGALTSVVELIADEIPEDQILDLAEKFDLQSLMPGVVGTELPPGAVGEKPPAPSTSMAGGGQMKNVDGPDVAGSTAKKHQDPPS